jgi:hypothetical protein
MDLERWPFRTFDLIDLHRKPQVTEHGIEDLAGVGEWSHGNQ